MAERSAACSAACSAATRRRSRRRRAADVRDVAPRATPPKLPAARAAPPKPSWLQRLKPGLSRSSSALTEGITVDLHQAEARRGDARGARGHADPGRPRPRHRGARSSRRSRAGRFDKEIGDGRGEGACSPPRSRRRSRRSRSRSPSTPAQKPHRHPRRRRQRHRQDHDHRQARRAASAPRARRVMLAAGDTFRAAAIEQLKIWGERTGAPVVARDAGRRRRRPRLRRADATRKADGADVLIIDTAGRLQNKAELMAELEKIVRVIKKLDPTAPHAVLLTLDATTGQNALNQVEIFRQAGRGHRPGHDQARRHGARRHPRRHRREIRPAGAFHRRRRRRRRPRALRRARFRRAPSPGLEADGMTFEPRARTTRAGQGAQPAASSSRWSSGRSASSSSPMRCGDWLAEQFPALAALGGPLFVATALFIVATLICARRLAGADAAAADHAASSPASSCSSSAG